MRIVIKDFRVPAGRTLDLHQRPTCIEPVYKSKKHYKHLLREHVDCLSGLQQLLYPSNRHAILLIFQAMDAAGKDGVIKHVMSGVNPQGCQVFSFKHPSATELQHDFLWRSTRDLPERGRIGIFNRSYYEEVLVTRVHPAILVAEGLPEPSRDAQAVWRARYQSIADLERHLSDNGTVIIKFYLHISKEEQRKRFIDRIDDPHKSWKMSLADLEERNSWKSYLQAYEEALAATSTERSPWYVVPADDKKSTRLIVSRIVVDRMENLHMSYPATGPEREKELEAMRARLAP